MAFSSYDSKMPCLIHGPPRSRRTHAHRTVFCSRVHTRICRLVSLAMPSSSADDDDVAAAADLCESVCELVNTLVLGITRTTPTYIFNIYFLQPHQRVHTEL